MSLHASSINGTPRKPAVRNRRVWVRYPCPLDTPGQLFNTESSQVLQGTVRNLSSGGIGLLMSEPVSVGTVLKIEVDCHAGPRMLVVRVTHVTEQPDGWLFGCELDVPLSGDQMRDLLSEDSAEAEPR
jgi:hypothetical protein